jgi:hypothetical protein
MCRRDVDKVETAQSIQWGLCTGYIVNIRCDVVRLRNLLDAIVEEIIVNGSIFNQLEDDLSTFLHLERSMSTRWYGVICNEQDFKYVIDTFKSMYTSFSQKEWTQPLELQGQRFFSVKKTEYVNDFERYKIIMC